MEIKLLYPYKHLLGNIFSIGGAYGKLPNLFYSKPAPVLKRNHTAAGL
ncbi:MAG: hypothetical protein HXO49_08245 [Prevotella sp.]|nr:hypothetical protein [Prevotella sp.]